MGEIFSEHKKIVYFFVFLLIFYYLVIVPSEIIIDNIHNIEMKEKRIENITLKEKITEKNIEKLKSQKEKLTEENRIFSCSKIFPKNKGALVQQESFKNI